MLEIDWFLVFWCFLFGVHCFRQLQHRACVMCAVSLNALIKIRDAILAWSSVHLEPTREQMSIPSNKIWEGMNFVSSTSQMAVPTLSLFLPTPFWLLGAFECLFDVVVLCRCRHEVETVLEFLIALPFSGRILVFRLVAIFFT